MNILVGGAFSAGVTFA